MPNRFEDRMPGEMAVAAILIPLVYGGLAAGAHGWSSAVYSVVILLGIAGGIAAGLEHSSRGSAAFRGGVAGFWFAIGVGVVDGPAAGVILGSAIAGGLFCALGFTGGRVARMVS